MRREYQNTRYIHVTDPPIELRSGEVLENTHVVMGGAIYGRMLFAESMAVFFTSNASNVTVRNNCFDCTAGITARRIPSLAERISAAASRWRRMAWWRSRRFVRRRSTDTGLIHNIVSESEEHS